MVRRSSRTTLGDATFALSPPWSLISSWTNSRFLSAISAFAFSIPATMATGQKKGRVISGGVESAGAAVSGMTASQGEFERRRFDRAVDAPDDEEIFPAPERASASAQSAAALDRLVVRRRDSDWRL